MNDIEKAILATLAQDPRIAQENNIKAADFSSPRGRTVFDAILKAAENGDGGTVNPAKVAKFAELPDDTIGDTLGPIFASSLLIPRKDFPETIADMRKAKLGEKLFAAVNACEKDIIRKGKINTGPLMEIIKGIDGLGDRKRRSIPLSEIRPLPMRWLWLNKIPAGCLNLIVGDPGAGKGILTGELAARISRGAPWPYTDSHVLANEKNATIAGPGTCLIISTEDNVHDTIRPRIEDAKGDLSKIRFLIPARLDIAGLIQELRKEKNEDPSLICAVIDPLADFMGNIRGGSNTEIRAALTPLVQFAFESGITLLGIQHLNKDTAKRAIYRTLDSIGYVAVARSVWLVEPDEDDISKKRRFLTPLKANPCKQPTTLAFTIDGPLSHPQITWETEPVTVNPDELLGDAETKERITAKEEAREFLYEHLKNGPAKAAKMKEDALQVGISDGTYQSARRKYTSAKKTGPTWWVKWGKGEWDQKTMKMLRNSNEDDTKQGVLSP